MKLAGIDIGSNAIRLLIEEVIEEGKKKPYFKKIALTRVPIRLGEDVFGDGKISEEKADKLEKALLAFKYLMYVHGVKNFRACATSAMREAANGKEIIKVIKAKTGIELELITGKEEADLIMNNFFTSGFDNTKTYLYIDVGGGSTEVSLIKNNKRITSNSFKLGTVRILSNKVKPKEWEDARKWVASATKGEKGITAIGTGGNINRIFKESHHGFQESISYGEIKEIVNYIESFSLEERIKKLNLKPDRADVIIPAGHIYLALMESAEIETMVVPKVGLSDGMIFNMYQKLSLHKNHKSAGIISYDSLNL
ncbi:MAG: Ppx/GppA phosphatase family protein [Flavobacteriales bacterium]